MSVAALAASDPLALVIELCGSCGSAIFPDSQFKVRSPGKENQQSNQCSLKSSTKIKQCIGCKNFFHRDCNLGVLGCLDEWKCKACSTCGCCSVVCHPGEKVQACQRCGLSAHAGCLPVYLQRSETWFCDDCVQCQCCGSSSPKGIGWSRRPEFGPGSKLPREWHDGMRTCSECLESWKGGCYCPVCLGLYLPSDDEVPMIVCSLCDRWVHLACDPLLTAEEYEMLSERPSVHYACPLCLPKVPELLPEEKRSNNFAWSLFRRQPAAAVSVKQAAAAETERVLSANQIQGCATTTCFISCFLCKEAGSFPLFPFSTFFSEAFSNLPDFWYHAECVGSLGVTGGAEKFLCDYILALKRSCKRCGRPGAAADSYHTNCNLRRRLFSTHIPTDWGGTEAMKILHRSVAASTPVVIKKNGGIVEYWDGSISAARAFRKFWSGDRYLFREESSTAVGMASSRISTPRSGAPAQYRPPDAAAIVRMASPSDPLVVHRSGIAGIGVYAAKEFNQDQCVIEYVGRLVGQGVANKRERTYDRCKIGCYMFRLGRDRIIDATVAGNKARFINHSCDPNCYTKVINLAGNQSRIIIFALRKIAVGEELCYDYKFTPEEAKIPCQCGALNCRGSMN